MGLIPFQPAQRASGPPEYREFDIQAGTTFTIGAPMQRNSGTPSDIEEHSGGGDSTDLIGVALFGATSGVPAGKGSTAYGTRMIVGIAHPDQLYLGQLTNAGAVVTPAKSDMRTYGMVKVTNDWYVDQEDIGGDVILQVVTIYPNIDAVLFKFLAASISP